MSEEAIFIVGIIIFAITIYGVVMAGGMTLTRVMADQDDDQRRREASDDEQIPVLSPRTP